MKRLWMIGLVLLALALPVTCAPLVVILNPTTATIKEGQTVAATLTMAHPDRLPQVVVVTATCSYTDSAGTPVTSPMATIELTIRKPFQLANVTLAPIGRIVTGSVKVDGTAVTPSITGVVTIGQEINEGQSVVVTYGVK